MFEIPELLELDNLKTKRYKDDVHLNSNSTWRQFYHDEYVKRDKEIDWTKDDETERERINSFVLTTLLNLHGKLLEEQIKRPATPPNQPKNITTANEKKNNHTQTPVKKRTNRELDENKGKDPTERTNTATTKKKASNKVPELTSENTGLEAIDEIIERNAQAWNKAYGKKPDETIADFSMFLVYLHPKTISRKTLDSLHDDLKVAYEEFMDNFQLELWIESFEKDPEDTQEKFKAALTILGEQGIKPVVLSGLPKALQEIYNNRFQKNNAIPTPQNGSKQADQMSIESTIQEQSSKPLQLTPSDGNSLDLETTSYGKETNESKKSEQTTVETPSSNQTLSKKINPFAVRYVKRYNEDRDEALVWFENNLRTLWLPSNLVLARNIVPDLPKQMQEIHKKHAKEVDKRKRIQEEERERKQRERALPLYKKQADVWENKYKQHPEDTKREFLDFLKSPQSAKISMKFIRELPDELREVYENYIKSENENEEEDESTTPRSPKRQKTSQNRTSSSSLSSGQQISHQLEVISVDGDSSGQQIRHQESIKTQKPPVIPVISVDDEMEIDNKIPVHTPPPLSSPVPVSSGSFVHRNSTLPLGLSFEEIQTRLAGYTSNPRNDRDGILFEIYNRAPFLFVLDLGPMRDQRGNWQRYPEKKDFDENTEFRLWVDNMIKIYELDELKAHFQDSLSKSIFFDKVNRPLRLRSENIYQNLITYNMYFGIGRFPDFKPFKYESNVYVYIYRRTTLRRQLGDVHALNPIQTQKFFLVKFSSKTTTFGGFDQTKMTYDMEFKMPTDPENNYIKVTIEFIKLRHHDGETYYYLNKKKETAVFRSQLLGNVSLEVLYMNPMTKRKQSQIIIKPK